MMAPWVREEKLAPLLRIVALRAPRVNAQSRKRGASSEAVRVTKGVTANTGITAGFGMPTAAEVTANER
jgi:hypothetical protein